jgi:molybdopterin-guanine dinucleotide biosynthesis protein A
MSVTGIVLAGGRSTRMGRDKASLPFGQATLLDHVVAIVRQISDDVIVVCRPDQSVPAGVRVAHDAVADQGPLAGLAAGLAAVQALRPEDPQALAIAVACDMPLVKPAVLERLLATIGDADIAVAEVDGHASVLCGVYRPAVGSVANDLLRSDERRVMALLDRVNVKRVDAASFRDIDPQLESFVSCDTPEAYQDALARTGSAARR